MDIGIAAALASTLMVRAVGVLVSIEILWRNRGSRAVLQLAGWVAYSAAPFVGLVALGSGSNYTTPGFFSLSVLGTGLLAASVVGYFRDLPIAQWIAAASVLLAALVLTLAGSFTELGSLAALAIQAAILVALTVVAVSRRPGYTSEIPVARRWMFVLVALGLIHVTGHLTIYPALPPYLPVLGQVALTSAAVILFVHLDSDMTRLSERRVRDELKASNAQLSLAQEIAHLGSWELDVEANQITWSEEVHRMFGLKPSRQTASFEGFLGQVHALDRQKVDDAFQRFAPGEADVRQIEYRVIRQDNGETRIIHQEFRNERDDLGNLVRSTGTVRDVTDARRAERDLQQRSRFDAVLAEVSSGLVGRSADNVDEAAQHVLRLIGELTGADRAYIFMFGEDRGLVDNTHEWCATGVEPQIENLRGVNVEADLPWFAEQLARSETISISDVASMPAEAATERHFLQAQDIKSLIIAPIALTDASIGFIGLDAVKFQREWAEDQEVLLRVIGGILATLFERTRAERLARESERSMELAIEGADLGTWDWDISTGSVIFNDRWTEMLGYELADIAPRVGSWEKLVHPSDMPTIQVILTAHLEGRADSYEAEQRLRHKDGHWVWVLARGRVIARDASGSALRFCGTHLDITERKLAEEALRTLNDHLELLVDERTAEAVSANQAKSEFLASISHELRTPLNSIIGFSGVMISGAAGDVNEEQMRQLAMIQASGKRLLSLVNDILDLSKIEAKAISVEVRETDINEVCAEAVESVRNLADARGVDLRFYVFPEGCAPRGLVLLDREKFMQILLNLLSNAVKFTNVGSIEVRVECKGEGLLQVGVKDTGIGIEPASLERIFEDFEQIPIQGEAKSQGTGLGLAISRRLAKLLGGDLTVESEPGVGSEFTLELPLTFVESSE